MTTEPSEPQRFAESAARRYAYADPPYLSMCAAYEHEHNDGGDRPFDGRCWNEAETHGLLIDWLSSEFPDGWALSLHTPALRTILPLCPADVRVAAWVKPFASYKPGVNPGYCWEPVIFRGGRRRTDKTELTVRDYLAAGITLKRGFFGTKPEPVCRWICDLLGHREGDEPRRPVPWARRYGTRHGRSAVGAVMAQFDGSVAP